MFVTKIFSIINNKNIKYILAKKIMNDTLINFNSTLEKIILASIKIDKIIKELEKSSDKIDVNVIESIDNIYKERGILTEKLILIFNESDDKDSLLKDNQLLVKYNVEIVPIEKRNIDFLNKKSIETKHKLTELSANKSLLIYNQKVELNYENKLV